MMLPVLAEGQDLFKGVNHLDSRVDREACITEKGETLRVGGEGWSALNRTQLVAKERQLAPCSN